MNQSEKIDGDINPSRNHESIEQWFLSEIKPHEGLLRAYLLGKYKDLEEIDDILHDAYVKIFKVGKFHEILNPKAFLFKTAQNVIRDRIRRNKIINFEELNDSSHSSVLAEDNDMVYNQVSAKEEMEMLVEAIGALPERCARVMTLRLVHQLNTAEIAESLSISMSTVRVQLARGVRRCFEHLKDKLPE